MHLEAIYIAKLSFYFIVTKLEKSNQCELQKTN